MPAGGSKLALATVTAAEGSLQPVELEQTLKAGQVPGSLYRIFVDSSTDIQENDRLKDEDGNIYTVKKGAVTRWKHGSMDYFEVYLTKGNA